MHYKLQCISIHAIYIYKICNTIYIYIKYIDQRYRRTKFTYKTIYNTSKNICNRCITMLYKYKIHILQHIQHHKIDWYKKRRPLRVRLCLQWECPELSLSPGSDSGRDILTWNLTPNHAYCVNELMSYAVYSFITEYNMQPQALPKLGGQTTLFNADPGAYLIEDGLKRG